MVSNAAHARNRQLRVCPSDRPIRGDRAYKYINIGIGIGLDWMLMNRFVELHNPMRFDYWAFRLFSYSAVWPFGHSAMRLFVVIVVSTINSFRLLRLSNPIFALISIDRFDEMTSARSVYANHSSSIISKHRDCVSAQMTSFAAARVARS